jgi:UDP-N-acetylmuramate--alanine ligase
MEKMRIGIIFGGSSKEREISFAGGRTVYDNLNKSLFEAIPLFVDSFGNFILLNWQFIYKGSIRDFYPPVATIRNRTEVLNADDKELFQRFQVYGENLENLTAAEQDEIFTTLGRKVEITELPQLMDFAFLCLHGPNGEDGRLQGMLEYLNLPYSGSGILPSAIGINKIVQRKLMVNAGFSSPKYVIVSNDDWFGQNTAQALFDKAKQTVGLPMVIKSATQGSSIGVTILHDDSVEAFTKAVNKSFFALNITAADWSKLSRDGKIDWCKRTGDIREGIGLPARVAGEVIYHPAKLFTKLESEFAAGAHEVFIDAIDGEAEIIIEGFIAGKEFSCIVVENTDGTPVALPPTEIRKGGELFDYRSKYLPGLSRKITPIDLPAEQIQKIGAECERMYKELQFSVYARIDGFINDKGDVFLNDPNTTSGMMPSSFFFHQAAEIGLNPSQFLTFIIRTSLHQRVRDMKFNGKADGLLASLDLAIEKNAQSAEEKIKIAVILGGYSSERHISVESGRNIYEKLSSSTKYSPVPVFLTGSNNEHIMYTIPVNILLKDNADDIKEKIEHYHIHPEVQRIMEKCKGITQKYTGSAGMQPPQRIGYNELAQLVDGVFIALHGRPGEDGQLQVQLEKVGLPYNGSGQESSSITIDKFKTNKILRDNGFNVAGHRLVFEDEWVNNHEAVVAEIENGLGYPLIAKPNDDGCSSAVKKIKTREELEAYAVLAFRKVDTLDAAASAVLNIKPKEEFPAKNYFLVETLISRNGAKHFLEITGGMLTRFDDKGEVVYEVFEASEALAEGEVLSLEEKFLAGEGQNITPARYSPTPTISQKISDAVKVELERAAKVLKVQGYCRIDAFVRVFDNDEPEVIFIEVNSLPGMTPATAIFHQTAINGYKPYEFIDKVLEFGFLQQKRRKNAIKGQHA